jgi:hypothetical protein
MKHNRRNSTASGKEVATLLHGNTKQDANVPLNARDQRRRRIAEDKMNKFPTTIILESQPSETITRAVVVVPNIAIVVPAVQRGLRMSIQSEGKRNVDSDSDEAEDLVPFSVILRKPPPKQKPDPETPKGLDAIGLIVARDFGGEGGIFHGRI